MPTSEVPIDVVLARVRNRQRFPCKDPVCTCPDCDAERLAAAYTEAVTELAPLRAKVGRMAAGRIGWSDTHSPKETP